jgi:hypothetical protein
MVEQWFYGITVVLAILQSQKHRNGERKTPTQEGAGRI